MKETKLQKLARLEEEGSFEQTLLPEAKRRQIEGAARQWATKSFKPYSSGSAAKADAE